MDRCLRPLLEQGTCPPSVARVGIVGGRLNHSTMSFDVFKVGQNGVPVLLEGAENLDAARQQGDEYFSRPRVE